MKASATLAGRARRNPRSFKWSFCVRDKARIILIGGAILCDNLRKVDRAAQMG